MVDVSSVRSDQPAVLCPRCGNPMMRSALQPIMFTTGLSNATYTCEPCQTELIRTENSDGAAHTAAPVANAS